MKRSLLIVLLAVLFAGHATAETPAERYWRIHRERNATTRYGAPPTAATNSLPAGYRLLEYVESTGAQYVDTELGYFSDFEIGVVLRQSVGNITLGTDNNNRLERISAANPKWQLSVNGSSRATSLSITTRADISYREGVLSGNGATIGTLQNSFSSGRMVLFSIGSRVPTAYPAIVFYLRCYDSSGVLVRDYIPVADTNGVAGLWDRVSGTMFYSATATPLVAGPEVSVDSAVSMAPEDQRRFLAPVPTDLPPELAGGDLWYDCLAIPEGNWLVECPIEGSPDTAWRAALCPSNILQALVWRHAVGLAPTNLPVMIGHDPSRVIGRIEGLWYEAGTGVVARISMSSAGYAEARSEKSARLSPDVRCFTTVTNVAIRSDIWVHENQDWIAYEAARRGDIDADSITNVPPGVQAVVMAPVYLRGLSLVRSPLLPTEWQQPVPEHLRDAYPTRPYRGWSWRR